MRTLVRCLAAIGLAAVVTRPAALHAQNAPATDAIKEITGAWEISNGDRDKICPVELKADAGVGGHKLDFNHTACANDFPPLKDAVAWNLVGDDTVRIVDARGKIAYEFTEVEDGLYESLRPGQPLTFLQSAAAAADETRSADQMTGDWNVQRGDSPPICTITLSGKANATDLPLRVKPGCDRAIVQFGPTSWQLDRGELILKSARGEIWRFGDDDGRWRLMPRR
jgi:hypothetical protein